ncbi:protein DpdG [Micromonospora sp. NPDC005113]
MDLLNISPVLALPVTLWAAAQVFAGTNGLTEGEAFRRLSPLGLRDAAKEAKVSGQEPPPTNGAVQAVRALEELKLLTEVARPDNAPLLRWTGSVPRTYDEFCEQMLGVVMARAHTEEVGETRTPGGARDLLRGLAWILTKNPASDAFSAASVLEDRTASADDARVFIQQVRWNSFRYWSEALGFTTPVMLSSSDRQSWLTCDASRAVGATLRQSFQAGTEHTAIKVIDELRERLPVLPGGAASIALGFSPPASNKLDAATSFALLALEVTEQIELRTLSDGTGTVQFAALDPAEPARIVTHLVVQES